MLKVEVSVTEQRELYAPSDPVVQQWLLEEYPYDKLKEAMNSEMNKMAEFDVADILQAEAVPEQVRRNALTFTWAHRWKGNDIRSRLCVRGFKQVITDIDDTYASTPVLLILKVLLVYALSVGWGIYSFDVTTAFLHATLDPGADPIYVWAPQEYDQDQQHIWRLKKAVYGLRTAPREWQDHFADELMKL